MRTRTTNIIGWIGMTIILIAYTLTTFGILSVQSPLYLVLNIVGSIGILLIALKHQDYQPAVLNAIWALIALLSLVRLFV